MNNLPHTIAILWTFLVFNVLPTSARYCYYSAYRYYCYTQVSIGSIVGAVIGGIIGLIVLTVIIIIVCSQMKTRGNRGTVVHPTTHISSVQYNSTQGTQQGFAQPASSFNYNQYPGASAPLYPPPPQNMAYPPPGQNYGPPPLYDGAPMKQ